MPDSDEDSDNEGPRRVVSAKDKRFAELGATVEEIKNKTKINDWVSIQVWSCLIVILTLFFTFITKGSKRFYLVLKNTGKL